MWLRSLASLFALAVLADATDAGSPTARAASPIAIATRQTLFAIPFHVGEAREPSRRPIEIQLYVSGDGGETWELSERVEPSRGHFLFRAAGDGQYRFLIRTLDRSGQLRPRDVSPAGLQVIIDTTPPRLRIEAQHGDAGQITVRWEITEPHPKQESLTIQYRAVGDARWNAIAVPRQKAAWTPQGQVGEVTWWPPAGTKRLQIRAAVSDVAGNSTVSHAQVNLEPKAPAQRRRRAVAESAPRTVHSRQFALEYKVTPGRERTLAHVGIWITQDNGQTWQLLGEDNDNVSPAVVNVDREGTYGFRIVARGADGRASPTPRPGDRPDIQVHVDLSHPSARITSVRGVRPIRAQ